VQGVHNFFVYGGELEALVSSMHIITNEEGWIATIQSMPQITRDRAGRVLNNLGQAVAVVHQYDRSPALLAQYDREYVWVPPAQQHMK
jgi:hypothetical protein